MIRKAKRKVKSFYKTQGKNFDLKRFIYIGAFIALLGGVLLMAIFAYLMATMKMPDLDAFDQRKVVQSTKIYDRTGEILLWDIYEDIQRTVVPLGEISRNAKNATVAIEDSNFYNHFGIEPIAILRSFITNITSGSKYGGSTITQQLVKNALLTREKKYVRKIKELILTFKIEKVLSKEEILEFYLNEIPYGGSNYGIEAASQNFFGKSSLELTLAESEPQRQT
jgi:penicillin-binding protein 1A